MSSNRYDFNADYENEASILRKENSTLSYTFNPTGKYGNQEIHITLLYIALSEYGKDWISLPHSHNFTEFFYITKGSGTFSVERDTIHVKAGDLIILNPTIEHTEISNPLKPMEYMVFGVEGIQFQTENQGCILLNNTHKSDLQFYFYTLSYEMKRNRPYRDFMCQNILNIIFTTILRNEALQISLSTDSHLSKECSVAKKYMEENFSENITVETLSSMVHLNKYYFIHKFTKEMGISPINYLIKKRVEESKHLLTSTNYSLSSISQIVGFSSPTYFSQAFKKATNLPPQDYRKKYGNVIFSKEECSS